MSAVLDLQGGRLVLDVGPRDHDLARLVPGITFNHHSNTWSGIAAWGTALAARGVFGADLTMTDAVREWGAERARWEQWVAALKVWTPPTTDDAPVFGWYEGLYPPQQTGVGYLSAMPRAMIADDAGGGKGVMVAVAIDLLPDDAFPVLIVCPRTVKHTHARHLTEWAPSVETFVVSGSATKRRKTIEEAAGTKRSVLVMNWESLRYHASLAPYGSLARTEAEKEPKELNGIDIRTVVADEAHRAKDPRSKQTRALWSVAHHASRVWATTATPVPDPIGFWSIMHTVAPLDFQSRVKFQDRYCLTEAIFAGGGRKVEKVRAFNPRTEGELRRITGPYMLRRTLDEIVAGGLPPIRYSTRWVEMGGKQEAAYKAMKKDMLAKVPSGIIAATDPMQQSLRLLQMASALPTFDADNRLVSFEEPSSKLDALCDWLDDMDPALSLVVFAASRRLIELCARKLEKRGDTFGLITGAQNEGARAIAEQDFQSGNLRVLLGTYGAMSEGITLTRAHHQMMLQRSFKLIENIQADGRCRRIGQESDYVEIIDVVSVNSYDESVFRSGAYKEETAQAVLQDPAWIKRELEKR